MQSLQRALQLSTVHTNYEQLQQLLFYINNSEWKRSWNEYAENLGHMMRQLHKFIV